MAEIRIVSQDQQHSDQGTGGFTRVTGVSQALASAEAINLSVATMPPGARLPAHRHLNCESALYVLRGSGYFSVGPGLAETLRFAAGDFIYVPAMAPHEVVNDSPSEAVQMVVARNAAEEIAEDYTAPASGQPRS